MENPEKYNLERAQEEARLLHRKVQTWGASDYAEAEQQITRKEGDPNLGKPLTNLWEEITGTWKYRGEIPPDFEAGPLDWDKVPKYLLDSERTGEVKKAIESINQKLSDLFPQSGPLTEKLFLSYPSYAKGFEINGSERRKVEIEIAEKSGIALDYHPRLHIDPKTKLGETVYFLTALLGGQPLQSERVVQKITEILRGKKVLILGDDFGTLSEVLQALGAEVIGIEYDERIVKIAHSGALAENGTPQRQVWQGDAWNIGNSESSLYRKLKPMAPFDMVYSFAFFNIGSGFFESQERSGISNEQFDLGLESLLADNGIQFHPHSDGPVHIEGLIGGIGGRDGFRDRIKKLRNPRLDELLDRVAEEISQYYNQQFETKFHDVSDSVLIRGHLLTRILPLIKTLKTALNMEAYEPIHGSSRSYDSKSFLGK